MTVVYSLNRLRPLSVAFIGATAAACSFLPAKAQVGGLPNGLPIAQTGAFASSPVTAPPVVNVGPVNSIDLTPVNLPDRAGAFGGFEQFRAESLYRLPGRVFFSTSTENTLRYESNIFQTLHQQRGDMVYRVLPNLDVGYALTPRTRIAVNYFFARDQYAIHTSLMSRNFQSVGIRLDHDIPINEKTTLTASLFARELFFNLNNNPNFNKPLTDIIPSLVLYRRINEYNTLYGSVLGQIRFRDVLGRFQEGDQFYSVGLLRRKNKWEYVSDFTLVTNFGQQSLRLAPANQEIILTMEAGRRLPTRIPLTAFVRAQPIFNMGSNQSTGYAGFNFRVFGGLRVELAKPAIFPINLKGEG